MISTPSSEDQQLNIIAQEVSSIQHRSLIVVATEQRWAEVRQTPKFGQIWPSIRLGSARQHVTIWLKFG